MSATCIVAISSKALPPLVWALRREDLAPLAFLLKRVRRLIAAGYRDAKREMARLRRVRTGRARTRDNDLEVEPAYRHEVA